MAYRPLVKGDRVKIMLKDHKAYLTFASVKQVLTNGKVHLQYGLFADKEIFNSEDLMVASDSAYGMFNQPVYIGEF